MGSLLNIFIIVLSSIVLIGVIVGVHELGHFLAARYFKVKVIRFKIGFGKSLFSFLDKEGTEFSVGILPLGGYVQMLGERGSEYDPQLEKNHLSKSHSYTEVSLFARAIITSSGPLANFILAIVAFFFIFTIGIKDFAPIVGSVYPDSLAEESHLEVGDRILSIDNTLVSGYRDINTLLASRIGESGTIHLKFQEEGKNIKSSSNIIISDWLKDKVDPNPIQSFGISPFIPSLVSSLEEKGPAQKAGVKKGDTIQEVNNIPILTWTDLSREVARHPNKLISFKVKRENQLLNIPIYVEGFKNNDGIVIGRIGVRRISEFSGLPNELVVVNRHNPLQSLVKSIQETYKFSILILDSVGKMISGSMPAENIGGPIQISVLAGSAAKAGFVAFLNMIAIISINLGLINLFPLPILDGGQLVLIALEKIKGSAISESFLEYFYKFGLIAIVMLMGFAIFNDIGRLT